MKRTTIRFDDDVLRRLKEKAAAEERTLQDVVNDLLRTAIDGATSPREPYHLDLPTWKARELPGVDICDRKTLYDIMDGI